jgi:microcompartment protein CcmL/EutN
MAQAAIGLIETRGLVGVIEAADVAAKSANIRLLGFEAIGGGLVSLRFCGDVASVQTAVQAGAEAARRVCEVVSCHVIPSPHPDLRALLDGSSASGSDPAPQPSTIPSESELETTSVAQLRQLVRQTPGVQLRGRQVSRANKGTLIAELQRTWREGSSPP